MKFRKRIQIFPGFRINISKSGISSTFGIPGASVNIGKNGTYLNTGIPGTGLYDRKRIDDKSENDDGNNEESFKKNDAFVGDITHFESKSTEELISLSMIEISDQINVIFNEKIELAKELTETKKSLESTLKSYKISRILIFGLFINIYKKKIESQENEISEIQKLFEKCKINIDVHFEKELSDLYLDLKKEFSELITCEKIWDNVSNIRLNQSKTKEKASVGVHLEEVNFSMKNVNIVESENPAFYFQNFNGDSLYLYPTFCLMLTDKMTFIAIDIRELEYRIEEQKMMYIEEPPADSEIIEETYLKVNKDGSPD